MDTCPHSLIVSNSAMHIRSLLACHIKEHRLEPATLQVFHLRCVQCDFGAIGTWNMECSTKKAERPQDEQAGRDDLIQHEPHDVFICAVREKDRGSVFYR